jgi:hypothetical protein
MRHPLAGSRMPLAIILTSVFLFAALAGAVERETIAGVVHVRNGAVPRDGVEHLRLEPAWRAGHAQDDIMFGLITRVALDEAGNLYVLDAQLSRAHVYDRDGTHMRTLFREGDGPGEVRGPRDLVLLADGRVGAVQEVPGKLIFVDRQGRPAGELRIGGPGVAHGGFCQTFSAFAGQDLLLMAGFVQSPGSEPAHMTQTSFLSRFDPEGREIASFCKDTNDLNLADFTFEENRHLAAYWWNAAVGPDGKVYVVPSLDRYAIHVFAGDGTLERVIERDCAPWRRTAAEKQHFVEIVRAIYGDAPIEIAVAPSDHEPVIVTTQRGLRVHEDGTIWVLTTHGIRDQKPGVLSTFDVFSADGEFVRQVAVHFDADARHDGVFLFGDDRAFVVKGFVDAMMVQFTGGRMAVDIADADEGTMEVICCRVQRTDGAGSTSP